MSDDVEQDAKDIMEDVADEVGYDISELQIPKQQLQAMYESVDEQQFRTAVKTAFRQLK